ncbi:MAG: 4-alpha-glucanotransferase [Acidimicrobiales bacterium]
MTFDAAAWGVDRGYRDAEDGWRVPPAVTIDAVGEAMDADDADPPSVDDLWIVRAGDSVQVGGSGEIHTEDDRRLPVDGVASNLPLGYHWLVLEDGRRIRLIVSPGRCHLPGSMSGWGWAVHLYATRSHESWGIGDLADLYRLATWSAQAGARLLLVSPLHSPTPTTPVQTSPYYPSSRCFRSLLHLSIDDLIRAIPAGAKVRADLAVLATEGRELNRERSIDRDEVLRLKLAAAELLWAAAPPGPEFDAWIDAQGEAQGDALLRWGQFCTLAEQHGRSWRGWPESLRDPAGLEVEGACDAARVRFHVWVQWLRDQQLFAASGVVDLIQDLAVGVDPGGADTWIWRDVYVDGVSIGAPPDEYNADGQNWGLPPMHPWKLRAAHFEPFIATVRSAFAHAGGVRIDHIMGLFRLFWIPAGASPADGTYVRYPWEEMLDIVALESHRAGAYVVGEDLGTVEPWVRDALAERNVLSYRLLWFEDEPPQTYPERSLAAVSTHDLPTVAGVWTGSDEAEQAARGMRVNSTSMAALRDRLRAWTGMTDDATVEATTLEAYRLLASAPSALITASLEDALAVTVRPNYPGTVGGTNWSLALPLPLESVMVDPRVQAIADVLNSR